MAKLTEVEGIGDVYAGKLQAAGINTTNDLLKVGATPAGRKEIAEKGSEKMLETVGIRGEIVGIRG